ncbi:MAG: hypothetical protein AB8G96_14190 [Phycisphaerales bacterium]
MTTDATNASSAASADDASAAIANANANANANDPVGIFDPMPVGTNDRLDFGPGLLSMQFSLRDMLGDTTSPHFRLNVGLPEDFDAFAWRPAVRPDAPTPLPQRDDAGYVLLIGGDTFDHHVDRAILGRLRDAGWCGLRISLPQHEPIAHAHISNFVLDQLAARESRSRRPLVILGVGNVASLAADVAGRLNHPPSALVLLTDSANDAALEAPIAEHLRRAAWPTLHLQPMPANHTPSTAELVTAGGVDQPWTLGPERTTWKYSSAARSGATWLPLLADPAARWVLQMNAADVAAAKAASKTAAAKANRAATRSPGPVALRTVARSRQP